MIFFTIARHEKIGYPHGIALRYDPESISNKFITHQYNTKEAVESGQYTKGYYWGH